MQRKGHVRFALMLAERLEERGAADFAVGSFCAHGPQSRLGLYRPL